MSLPIPLTVRLSTARADRHITADARDLAIRWTDPGGYASCRVSLDRPLSLQPDEIAYYGRLTVYDARHGGVVWDGRLEDPGRSAGADGQVWELVAVGGQAHTRDIVRPLVYVDTSLQWVRVDNATPGGDDQIGADPGDPTGLRQALILRFPQGLTVSSGSRVVVRHYGVMEAGQTLARISYTWDAGITSPNLLVELVTRDNGDVLTGEIAEAQAWSTSGGSAAPVVVTDFPAGRNTAEFWIQYSSTPGTISVDTWWVSIHDVAVRTLLMDRTGAAVTTGYTTPTVLASEVVADLLGRLLPQVDGAGATIATTTHPIEQLAYPDGVDAYRVLSDLMAVEAGHTWRVWEHTSAGYRFEWTPVPAEVRYEADVTDGYDAPGSADGLYDSVVVRWRDTTGQTRSTVRTATSPVLAAAGLSRQGWLDLGSEVGSAADAEAAGDAWLADRISPPNAGRLRIGRPILDMRAGRMVEPWEIRPGLIRVRGILPRADALNASTRDGVTIMRIVASEYVASDAVAVLELDSYAPSTARALATLQRQRVALRP